MPIETIVLELQNEEKDIRRVLPFISRKFVPFIWYFPVFMSLFFIVGGLMWTTYRLTTINTFQYTISGSNHFSELTSGRETLFEILSPSLLMTFCGLLLYFLVLRRVPILLQRAKKMNPAFFQPLTLIISEEGIEDKRNATNTKYQWSFVKVIYEKFGGFLIVYQSNVFHFIPAKKISEENYLKVREIFKEKVGIKAD